MASSNIPKTMRGILIEQTGGVEVLQYRTDLPVPEPKEGELLVKNEYIGINYIDTYFRTALYPSPLPLILGREAASTVLLSSSPHFPPSSHVVWHGTAAYAEYSAVPASNATLIPADITPLNAAASLLQGLTALTLVEEAHHVEKGEVVLVHAAAGGTGLWLCQILRAKGARVIGTASTSEKRAEAEHNGANVTCGYGREEVLGVVKRETNGEGVRAVFDGVGKATWEMSLEAVGRKGTLVSFGNASGAVEPFPLLKLSAKNIKVCRPTLFNYIYTPEEFKTYTNELWRLMTEDKFNVRIHEVYKLEDVKRAHSDLESRKTSGKLLLKV